MKFLYLAKDTIEAEIIKDKLQQKNIPSYILGNNLHIAIGELPLHNMYVKIFVSELYFDSALKFINEYKTIINKKNSGNWQCPTCGEVSPNTILVCWNCGFEKI